MGPTPNQAHLAVQALKVHWHFQKTMMKAQTVVKNLTVTQGAYNATHAALIQAAMDDLFQQSTAPTTDEALLHLDGKIQVLQKLYFALQESKKPIQRLTCCCCGTGIHARQFHNQDTGYGLGDCCVEFVKPRVEDMERTYGLSGIHYNLTQPV